MTYEERLNLVTNVLAEHSKMSREAAEKLARHVLYAIDHVPEKVR